MISIGLLMNGKQNRKQNFKVYFHYITFYSLKPSLLLYFYNKD